MTPIFFCKRVSDKFTHELKLVQRECARDREKRARDELKRKTNLATQTQHGQS